MSKLPKYIYLFYVRKPIENDDFYTWLCYDSDSYPDSVEEEYRLRITDKSPESEEDPTIFLYGFTTHKKLVKDFMLLRNKNKIIVVKENFSDHFLNQEHFERFTRCFRKYEIGIRTLCTRSYSNNNSATVVDVPMVITQFEKEFIDTCFEGIDDRLYEFYNNLKNIDIIFGCLTNDTKHILADTGFINFIKFIKNLYEEKIDGNIVCIDEMQLFFEYFKELFIEEIDS